MNSSRFVKMNVLPIPKYYELVIAIIFILCQVSNSIQFNAGSSFTDLEPLGNTTNYYDYLSYAIRRYRRQTNFNGETCIIPSNPPHTTYVILSESETNYKPGDYVRKLSVMEIKCDKGYQLSPFASSISNCIKGEWKQTPTSCIRACPSLMSSATTIVQCSYNGIQLPNCIHPVKGTTVRVSCNEFYEEATLEINPFHDCRENEWVPAIPQCYSTCGIKTPKGNTDIVMGRNATPGDYPWHVGIYTSQKEFQCGGSIIDSNIILSAAHCFTDYNGELKPVENYLVAAGKYYREYDHERDALAQYSTILEIHIPERYRSIKGFYAFDIAILILKDPFELSIGIQPVCIELNRGPQFLQLSSDSQGIVMGWGYTQEGSTLSDILKELTIPYIPYNQCIQEITESFKKFVTFDKICAGYLNKSSSVCDGDSGGGFVFKNFYNNRYYVKAIVSASPASTHADVLQCDTNQYSVYTLIEEHIEFVRQLIIFNRRQQSVICQQDDCKNEQTKTVVNCRLPNNPLHGKYFLPNQNNTYTPGNNVSQFVALFLTCDVGFEASPLGATQFICLDENQWSPAPGTCTGICPSLTSSTSTNVTCEHNGTLLNNCEHPKDGTIVSITCNPFYEEPSLQDYSIRICTNGKWNSSIPECYPICGKVPSETPRESDQLLNSTNLPHDYPWHVGIYRSDNNFICSGSIITPKIILTVAQCVTNYDGRIEPSENYFIAAGKHYRNYVDERDKNVQYSNVSEIHVPETYRGVQTFFSSDVAILILSEPFTLSIAVQPVCIESNKEHKDLNIMLDSNSIGIVTGWGFIKPGGPVAEKLKQLIMPYVPYDTCFEELPTPFRRYLTFDKMCAGYLNKGISICKGDSGDGFVLKNILRDRYYIIAIASISPIAENGECDLNQYALYTLVSRHSEFIIRISDEFKNKKIDL